MVGTLLNVATVLAGGLLGTVLGTRLPERLRETALHGLGLVTLVVGIQLTFQTENILIVMGSILVGVLLGEWWRIEDRLQGLGKWLEARVSLRHNLSAKRSANANGTSAHVSSVTLPLADRASRITAHDASPHGSHLTDPKEASIPNSLGAGEATPAPPPASRFVQGFVTASLVFCVGPMTILGSIQDGLTGDYRLLAIKSLLDGFAALAFASALGPGVVFSVLTILVYQGALTLLAGQAQSILTEPMIAEMTATGGVMVMAIGLLILELKRIRVGNFLPALVIAPLVVAVLQYLGLYGVGS